MSGVSLSEPPEDGQSIAAGEYVLGVLEGDERRRFEAELSRSADLARMVRLWEDRLADLSLLAAPVAPPADLWARIARQIERSSAPPRATIAGAATLAEETRSAERPAAADLWRRASFWRPVAFATTALAAGLAALLIATWSPRPVYVSALAPANQAPAAFVVQASASGRVTLIAIQPKPVDADRSLELWALPQGEKRPRALGLIPVSGEVSIAPEGVFARDELMLLVSLEPKGGSPTGQPTGPVLYAGKLTRVR